MAFFYQGLNNMGTNKTRSDRTGSNIYPANINTNGSFISNQRY